MRAYDDYRKLSHLQYCYIDDHRELAKDVYLTRYSNGEETVVNYGKTPFDYRGRPVKPVGYELFAACEKELSHLHTYTSGERLLLRQRR